MTPSKDGGIIILPSKADMQPERGAGLDRDGPPRDSMSEHWCVCKYHDRLPIAMPRRFDAPDPSPPICPACRRMIRDYDIKARELGVLDGNHRFAPLRVRRGIGVS